MGYNGTILTSTVGVGPTPTPTPTQYTITASVDYGTGSISCTPTVVDSGGTSTCTVTPGSGQMLVSLTDNGTNVINKVVDLVSYTITNITANHTIVATFATTSVCTNVTITPTSKNFPASGGIGNVSVTTNTNCSFTFSSDASWITNLYGTPGEVNNDIANYTISYAVTPNTGSQRTGIITISGQTFTVTQDGQATDVTLTVVKAGEGSGAVTITPPGIDCSMNTPSAECRVPFAQGTSVTLTAAADTGSTFTGWSGDCSGTTSTCTLTMSAAKNVTATFNAAPKPKHTTHDFDGDGKSDILWQNVSNGAVGMWFMNGPSIADGKIIVPQNYTDWQMVDVGDFDGNGKTDILWQNASTGQLYIWLMDGSTIMPTSGSPSIIPDLDWQIVGIGDFDGDGESDILWQNGWNGDVAIWFMNGTNIVFDKSKTIQIVDDSDWWIYAVGDFDGNGKSDILWQNASTGQLYIWLMDGSNIMPTSGSPFTVSNTDWQIVDVGDFDGDGKSDILWQDAVTGAVAIWFMNASNITSPKIVVPKNYTDWQIVDVGDFNGDGKSDILWRQASTGQLYIWLMDGSNIMPTSGSPSIIPELDWQVFGSSVQNGEI
ncbi:MAG: VCBS repeat-containing protein [Magnetococcales bacterium]|nr:VCBS repeat-containing protein [Nitrospirota bacterium]